jgi:hypothetical protein
VYSESEERFLGRTSSIEVSSTLAHAVREATNTGDMGDSGVERIGVKEVERVERLGVGDDEGDEKDDIESDDEAGDVENRGFKEGQYGRGRIRRALCVEDTVFACAVEGTAGKARVRRGGVTFCTEATGNRLVLAAIGRAPRGRRVKDRSGTVIDFCNEEDMKERGLPFRDYLLSLFQIKHVLVSLSYQLAQLLAPVIFDRDLEVR